MLHAALLSVLLLGPLQEAQRPPAEILSEIRARGNQAPAKLFEELAQQRSPEAFEALLKGIDAVSKVPLVCAAYHALRHLNGVPEIDEAAADYLARRALQSREQLALHAVYRLGQLWPASQDELTELVLEHGTADGRCVALMHLVERGMPLNDKALKRLGRSKDPAVRYEVLLARAVRVEPAAERARDLAKLARARDPVERLVAVELLATASELPERFELLARGIEDEDPRVARKAIASLERTREARAVELLIGELAPAGPGRRFRISRALERLTGLSLGTEPGRWERWWAAKGADFEVPREPQAPAPREAAAHTSSSFYGLPIYAESLVFAIDASDSMKKATEGGGGPSRIEVAKRELGQAVASLPASSSFDIVHFGQSAWSWQGELVPASDKHKRAADKHLRYLELSWGTEIYKALREAFRDPRADTILLLTDGDPQLSLMQDRAALRRIVAQWNRTRSTSIDCLSIGTNRGWLRKLAESTGGRYREID